MASSIVHVDDGLIIHDTKNLNFEALEGMYVRTSLLLLLLLLCKGDHPGYMSAGLAGTYVRTNDGSVKLGQKHSFSEADIHAEIEREREREKRS